MLNGRDLQTKGLTQLFDYLKALSSDSSIESALQKFEKIGALAQPVASILNALKYTDFDEKNNVLTKISQIYRGTYYFARKKLIEQCPDEITPDMWKSINATLRQRTDRFYKNAIYKCLSTWTNSRHTIQLEDIACEKVNQFNTWLNKQTKLLKDLHQKSQARLNHYMNSEMLAC